MSAFLRFIEANRSEEPGIREVEKDGLKNVFGVYRTLGEKL